MTRLDFAVASHFHADHIGGLDEVEQGLDGIQIGALYDRGGSYSTVAYSQYQTQFAGRRITPTHGQTLSLCGEVEIKFVALNGNGVTSTDENALSLMVKLSFGNFDALVGGDLTSASPDIESALAAAVGEVELYKVHHHGSSTSSNANLLGALKPTVSFISLAWNKTAVSCPSLPQRST